MNSDFKPFIQAVARGEKLKRDLTYDESVACMRMILNRSATDAQIGALLMTQRVKGEAVEEINGFTAVLRKEFMEGIRPQLSDLLDIGCPYNGKTKTAQLAPVVALTLHAAGVPVMLHGGEGVPTKTGITPGAIIRGLGLPADHSPSETEKRLEKTGFGFLDITQFAPTWEQLIPMRKQFGLRTVCNTIEKFFNPADAPYQVSGFFHANYIERIRSCQTGQRASWMIQGEEGSIETASGRRTRIYGTEESNDLVLAPADVGLPERERITVSADLAAHLEICHAVICGRPGPATDQVALTAGTILFLLKICGSVVEGYEKGQRLLHDQAVRITFEKLTGKAN